ncbi:hypothetical protein B0H17DRAFT_1255654 [Mycena rosella]|uniref:Uncharacterized protein n=1 Tax=Mycena rosella TaxID=1033263 RepID=A0AAD7GPN3_MYCRO|nr:hypothetical protein B0H17DRAFT_1255654 [Mycena rosella]
MLLRTILQLATGWRSLCSSVHWAQASLKLPALFRRARILSWRSALTLPCVGLRAYTQLERTSWTARVVENEENVPVAAAKERILDALRREYLGHFGFLDGLLHGRLIIYRVYLPLILGARRQVKSAERVETQIFRTCLQRNYTCGTLALCPEAADEDRGTPYTPSRSTLPALAGPTEIGGLVDHMDGTAMHIARGTRPPHPAIAAAPWTLSRQRQQIAVDRVHQQTHGAESSRRDEPGVRIRGVPSDLEIRFKNIEDVVIG